MPTGEWADVYEPAEDTHLLMDCLSSQADFLRQLGPRGPAVCAEVGCGSGVVIAHLAALCPSALCVATDVNPAALAHTARHARDAGVGARVAPVRTDVAAALLPRLKGAVDVLVFNPPCVEKRAALCFLYVCCSASDAHFVLPGTCLHRATRYRRTFMAPASPPRGRAASTGAR